MRTPHHIERIVDPPGDDLAQLVSLLCERPAGTCSVDVDGERADVPEALREVLADIVAALARGESISLASHEPTLTTQEAADLLGVSRPTLVRLLDKGEIAYDQPGSHRRLSLRDVTNFQRSHHHELEQSADDETARA
jgi:excisionase family DNA binding protein